MRRSGWLAVMILSAVMFLTALPVLAGEPVEEPPIVREMVREMVQQGVPAEGALRLARQNRFMAEMVAGTLEREALKTCDCEPAGDGEPDRIREHDGSCELAETGEALQQRVRARTAAAFGRALGAACSSYGEAECSQAAMALFSGIRRGLSPETGAATVEAFAENGYPLQEMYRFQMWIAERVSTETSVDEEALCEAVRTMARQRLQVSEMTRRMEQAMSETDGCGGEGAGQTQARTGQTSASGSAQSGNGQSGNGSSGGNSGGNDSGSGDGNGGGGNGGSGQGR